MYLKHMKIKNNRLFIISKKIKSEITSKKLNPETEVLNPETYVNKLVYKADYDLY